MINSNISFTERLDSVDTKTENTSNTDIQDTPNTKNQEYLKNVIPGSLVDSVLYFIPNNLHYKFKEMLPLFIKNEISKEFLYYFEYIQSNGNDILLDATAEDMKICDDCREEMEIIQFPE